MRSVWLLLSLLVLLSFTAYAEDWDRILQKRGYVDVHEYDPNIQYYLKYATDDNFMGRAVYREEGLTRAWLHPDAALKLHKAQQILRREKPMYSLMVYDAARPMKVQRVMWDLVRGTKNTYYVANPSKGGGLHNYGMAVDVTIIDITGRPLPMGSPYDYFGTLANTDNEEALLKKGEITQTEFWNRRLLRRVMREAGFSSVSSEWWHFNACSRSTGHTKYRLIE